MRKFIGEREVDSLAARPKSAMEIIVTVVEEGPFQSTKMQHSTIFASNMENAK